jgi:hypothetical protein
MRRAVWGLLPVLLVVVAAAAPRAVAADSFAVQLLKAGEKEIQELKHAEAVAYLSEALKLAEASNAPADRSLIPRIRELRAVAHVNLGDAPAAERDFAAMVEADPSRDLDRSLTSPKILSIFDRVRAGRTGMLTVRCDPPDCRILLGPEKIEILAPVIDRRVQAGQYQARIERRGFEPLDEVWTVEAGRRLERQVRLVPNSQSFQVLTIPPGAKVLLDGVKVGVTKGPAPPEYQDRAHQAGVTLVELSAPLLVPYVGVGKHELRIERDCHQTARFALEVRPDMRSTVPITFKPVKLKAELSTLEVHGSPAGGEVRVDGAPVGKIPLRREGVCAGPHRVEVRFPTGATWTDRVELPAGGTHRVQAYPRPTVAFLGLVQLGSGVRSDSRLIESRLDERLDALRRLSVERRDRSEAGRGAWAGLVSAAPIETADGSEDLLAVRFGDWVRGLAGRSTSDLFLGAVLRHRVPRDEVHLYLASTLGAAAEVRRAAATPAGLSAAFGDLDQPFELREPWPGWTVIDAPGGGPPLLTSVAADSPAARAGLRPGERVKALDEEPAGDAASLGRLLAAVEPGETTEVRRLRGDGQESSVTLAPAARPKLLPLDSPAILYHAAFAHLRNFMLGRTDPASLRLAALNMAVVLLRFDRAEEALQSYLHGGGGGALEAVTQYLRARCLERLGDKAGARAAYEASSRVPASDLEPPGLPVSLLAAEALGRPVAR